LCARLREADQDGAAGTIEELERIVGQIREVWPDVKIIIRGDSGYCRPDLMTWCEKESVDYVLGFAKNDRLKKLIAEEMEEAKKKYEETEEPARVFKDF